jgi:hypothetical protein
MLFTSDIYLNTECMTFHKFRTFDAMQQYASRARSRVRRFRSNRFMSPLREFQFIPYRRMTELHFTPAVTTNKADDVK